MSGRSGAWVSGSAIALAMALSAGSALAQAPAADAGADPVADAQTGGLADIVVTAQKRVENVQDTPISISVLGSEQLKARGIQGIQDLMAGAVPSIKIGAQAGRANGLLVTMRGITSGDSSAISRDAAVGIYIDGVYMGRVQGLQTELFDLERIEVLRGPQGTLFGRNAVGGALNIISKRPTGELGGTLTGGLSNYDGRRLKGTLNLPEFAGISIKLDGIVASRDGWADNPLRGEKDWGQRSSWGFRAQAEWQPVDGLDILYAFDIAKDKSTPVYTHISRAPAGALPPLFNVERDRVKRGRIGVPLDYSVADTKGHALTINWDISEGLALRSITAYREVDQTQDDNDGGYLIGFRPNGTFARQSTSLLGQDQFSQELQLIGTSERLEYVIGAFYFDEDANDSAYSPFVYTWNATGTAFTVNNPPIGGRPPDRAASNHVKAKALFGQATWTPAILDDRLHLTAGLRYTDERKRGTLDLLRGVPSNLAYRFASKRTDPMVTIAYDVTDDSNVYAKYGVAFRSGGGNSRSPTFGAFAEEELRSWELGFKSEFWDRRARLNIAAFDSDYKDTQIVFPYPTNRSASEIVNVPGTIKIRGVEADLTLAPIDNLTLTASYSYLHNKVPPIVSPLSNLVVPFALAYTPKHSGSIGADYRVPIGEMTLNLHADAGFSSRFYTFADVTDSPGYFLVNARATLADIPLSPNRGMSIALWGRNIFNEQFETFKSIGAGANNTTTETVNFNEPRTYGVEVTITF